MLRRLIRDVLGLALRAIGLSVSAAHRGEATEAFPAHTFLAYVAECATPNDAERIARAAKEPASSDVAELAVRDDRLCAVLIARSTVKGIASVESTDSITRFRDPTRNAISEGTSV